MSGHQHSETGGPEHDYEPVPGLPARLPEGETILWQGAPLARQIARRKLKVRWISAYFLVLIVWNVMAGIYDGRAAQELLFSSGALTIMAAIVIALLEAFAWGVAKTTLYTITNRRVVMRIGVALSATFNLPFAKIAGADMRSEADGSGDLALTLMPGEKLSWLIFWPHVRGFRKGALMPQMTGLKDVADVAAILAPALAAFHGADSATATVTNPQLRKGRKAPESAQPVYAAAAHVQPAE